MCFVNHMLQLIQRPDHKKPVLPMHVSSLLYSCLTLDELMPVSATMPLLLWLAGRQGSIDSFVVSNSLIAATGLHRGNREALEALHPALTALLAKATEPLTIPQVAQQLLMADAMYMQGMLPAKQVAAVLRGDEAAPDSGALLEPSMRAACLQLAATAQPYATNTGRSMFHTEVKDALHLLDVTEVKMHAPMLPIKVFVDFACMQQDGSQLALLLARDSQCFLNAPDVVDGRMQVQREVLHAAGIPVALLDKPSWEALRNETTHVGLLNKRLELLMSRMPVPVKRARNIA